MKDPYDEERYRELMALAAEMASAGSGLPVSRVTALYGAEKGYATPKVDIRAVVFDPQGRLLLVRERSDGRWSLPGGWADVGESPGEIAAREVREESGYAVRPRKVLAVLDMARHPHPPQLWYIYKILIRCDLVGGEAAGGLLETDGAGFFGPEELPPLSTGRITEQQIRRMFEHHDRPDLPADFD